MSGFVAAAQLALLTALLFTALGSLVASLASPHLFRRASSLPPAVATARLRWILAAPLAGGLAMTVLVFMPSVLASIASAAHHCTSHEGHPHLCLVHLPHETSTFGWLLLASAVGLATWRVRPLLAQLVNARRLVGSLPSATQPGPVTTLATEEPICAAVGWWAPRVVISESFAAGVGEDGVRAAIAHELAHARRRDALWSFLSRVAAIAFPASVSTNLLSALDLATERACDEEAGVDVGDRMLVADAILRSQRLGLRAMEGPSAAFGPGHWSLRVSALLEPLAPAPAGWRRWDVLALAAVIACVGLSGELHHAAETALSILAH